MADDICQIVYCSRNTITDCEGDVDAEVARILDVSRRNNAREQLTGALLYSAGVFAQVLEGPLSAVERTFERIQCDPRHSDVVVLHLLRSDHREFADWSMAYAGKLAESDEAARALSDAQRRPGAEGAELVLATLRDLVSREEEWAPVS